MPLPLFIDAVCASRRHCQTCRASAAWRAMQGAHYTLPPRGIKRCPLGVGDAKRSLPPAKVAGPMDHIGPGLWADLHSRAAKAAAYLSAEPDWLDRFTDRLPCGICKQHWRRLVRDHPAVLSSPAAYFGWTVARHNDVNRRIGKPTMPYAQAASQWGLPPLLVGSEMVRARVISLKRTPDRLRDFWETFPADWPFVWPQVFAAVEGQVTPPPAHWRASAPAWGCLASHLAVVRSLAVVKNLADSGPPGPVLILEDDAQFAPGALERLRRLLPIVPPDADLLFLGGQHFRDPTPTSASPEIALCHETGRTHAYVIYPRFFARFIELVTQWNTHIDWGLQHWAKTEPVRFYALLPFVALQRANRSTLTNAPEPARSWNRKGSDLPLVWLTATRELIATLRVQGKIHTGHQRDPASDVDIGLLDLLAHPNPTRAAAWRMVILKEAAAMPEATPVLWHPTAGEEEMRGVAGDEVMGPLDRLPSA